MRSVGVVTGSRADYGIYLPLLRRIRRHPDLELQLFATGMHLSPEFGLTWREIDRDGFPIAAKIEMLLSADTPQSIAASMGLASIGFAQAYAQFRPDILLVLGDRFEMHAAVTAAVPFQIPIAHIAGGSVTLGAIDDGLRHSITKLSHLHFAETRAHADRIIQMGEEPWRVTPTGALGLDHLAETEWMSREDLNARFALSLDSPPLVVTFHPVTREFEHTEEHIGALLASLAEFDVPMVFTYPNADTAGRIVIDRIKRFVSQRAGAWIVPNLGTQGYLSLLRIARAMVGNSSSGIVEAPSFKLPVVDIGSRQRGRLAAENVLHVECTAAAIAAGVRHALCDEFRAGLSGLVNPFGDGCAGERMIRVLLETPLDSRLRMKGFHDC